MLYAPPPAGPFRVAGTAALKAIRVITRRFAIMRHRQARRTALRELMHLDAALLDDLGIDRADVLEALARPDGEAARLLDSRRVSNAARVASRR